MVDTGQARYEEPQRTISDDEIRGILEGIRLERPDLFAEAQVVFARFVGPHEPCGDEGEQADGMMANALFTEWFFYDYELGMELSPLQLYSMADPTVEEYADTQFFSQFWVMSQNRRTGEVRLRDTRTRKNFDVIDKRIACQRTWAHGLLGVRLARVDGTWLTCGTFRPHDGHRSRPRPASHEGFEGRSYDRTAMLTLGAKVLGQDDGRRAAARELATTG